LRRVDGKIATMRRADIIPGCADERTRDHAGDVVGRNQDLARGPAGIVQLLEWNSLFMRRNLEYRVGGRIHDPRTGALVLFAILCDDRRPARYTVAEHPALGAMREFLKYRCGKAFGVRWKRLREMNSGDLP